MGFPAGVLGATRKHAGREEKRGCPVQPQAVPTSRNAPGLLSFAGSTGWNRFRFWWHSMVGFRT